MNTDIISLVEMMTQEDCREMGKLLIEMADQPRDARWKAEMAMARDLAATPKQRTLADAITAGRQRVTALSDGLRADGMDHRTLIEAELVRRGDPRTYEQYRDAVGAISSDVV
ncbi:hypothetical protein K7W03_16145 [Sphingobium sp. PNB]|uniref:hypothetical protein n=1 Tax=Sphingobium sp. PNB TaxID=863934 RepID=UPI001CA46D32|nr:hypothetical protein [Sphingobium sp. PNB]MCB4861123.1 hypothetical protein [Sphingobium sp. PNB]